MATFGPLRIVLTGLLLMHAGAAGAQGPGAAAGAPGMPVPLISTTPVRPAPALSAPAPSLPQPSAPEHPAMADMLRPPTIVTTGSRIHPVVYRLGTMDRPGLTARVAGPGEAGRSPAHRDAGAPP